MTTDTAIIDTAGEIRVQDCYQCGKCTAGCPVAGHMDVMPNQIVRLAQMGMEDRAMLSESVWLCVSCQTCTTRCPKSVDCAGVMDAMRQLSAGRDAVAPAMRNTLIFMRAFLDNIRRNGRLNELELVGQFKTAGFFSSLSIPFLFKDAMLGPKMMSRRKLRLLGKKVRDRAIVKRIFERCHGKTADTPLKKDEQ
ncbi:MAG: 4Fe-4S dicluster domain-containing protein [bacterium]|nr:4Fe-4S dicluster domain-containing protein [Candidatus Sumerlaeota bacterium]